MDLQQFSSALFEQHKNVAMFLLGAIGSHPVLCADLVFKGLMRTPFKPLVLKAAPTIIAWADTFEAEIAKNVKDEEAKEAAAASSTPSTPPA